ncbi:ABC transporter permease [Frateuria aurantia]
MRSWILQIRPTLKSLRKQRFPTTLIILQIALTCAVLCNAIPLIANHLAMMKLPSGVDESQLAVMVLHGCTRCRVADVNARAVDSLKKIEGVQSVTVVSTVPFGLRRGDMGIKLSLDAREYAATPHFYTGGPGSPAAMGLHLSAGRQFTPDDYRTPTDGLLPKYSDVWTTQSLAQSLWPMENPLGKEFWSGRHQFRVVGIVSHLSRPDPIARGPQAADWSVFVPIAPETALAGTYLIRASKKNLMIITQRARSVLTAAIPEAVLDLQQSRTVKDLRRQYFTQTQAMSAMLISVGFAMLVVNAIGIIGMANQRLNERRRQIGIRRSLGATRQDIQAMFQLENIFIAVSGAITGIMLAYLTKRLLMRTMETGHLTLKASLAAAGLLILITQIAAFFPALKASRIDPATAIRRL